MSQMARSDYGLDSPRDEWRDYASCTETRHLHQAERQDGEPVPKARVRLRALHAQAIHICRRHCPVLAHCGAEAARLTPRGQVQGGVVYADRPLPRPVAWQPRDPGHGPWCYQFWSWTK